MAGIANPNYAASYIDDSLRRSLEVPNADWAGGVNPSGSNSPGIGINTGDYSPKAEDWSEDVRDPQNGQHLGEVASPIQMTPDGDDEAGFVQTTGSTNDGSQIGTTGYFNRSGKTAPAGVWMWGTKAAP